MQNTDVRTSLIRKEVHSVNSSSIAFTAHTVLLKNMIRQQCQYMASILSTPAAVYINIYIMLVCPHILSVYAADASEHDYKKIT
jgi:hypothetical protein